MTKYLQRATQLQIVPVKVCDRQEPQRALLLFVTFKTLDKTVAKVNLVTIRKGLLSQLTTLCYLTASFGEKGAIIRELQTTIQSLAMRITFDHQLRIQRGAMLPRMCRWSWDRLVDSPAPERQNKERQASLYTSFKDAITICRGAPVFLPEQRYKSTDVCGSTGVTMGYMYRGG